MMKHPAVRAGKDPVIPVEKEALGASRMKKNVRKCDRQVIAF